MKVEGRLLTDGSGEIRCASYMGSARGGSGAAHDCRRVVIFPIAIATVSATMAG